MSLPNGGWHCEGEIVYGPFRLVLPATILDADEHRRCHACGAELADRQAHFDEQGRAFCVDHRWGIT